MKSEREWPGFLCFALPPLEFQKFLFAVLQSCMSSSFFGLVFSCLFVVFVWVACVCGGVFFYSYGMFS